MASAQAVVLDGMTSSKTGTFYFAFGSNLSPSQMRGRLDYSVTSSEPIAIARLDGWKWIICERGYANVVELPKDVEASDDTTVWGVLYDLSAEDEATLDMYEGHNELRNMYPEINPNPKTQQQKPFMQGGWDYNKMYLPVTVTKWLKKPESFGLEAGSNAVVRVLVYVDEERTREGTIIDSYIGRMNRAIDEGIALGMPKAWCEKIMRKWVTAGIYPHVDYVGTSEGYVPTETGNETTWETWNETSEQEEDEAPWETSNGAS